MNKKIALYFAPMLLAGCVTQQANVRRDVPAGATPAQQQQNMPARAPAPVVSPAAAAAPAPVRPSSPSLQRAIEDTVLCRVAVHPHELNARMAKEGVLAGPARKDQAGSDIYRLRTPIAVLGMPIKTISFWGDDESDAGQWVAVTVDGTAQSVVKALTAKGIRLKKVPRRETYEYRARDYGTVQVISEKGADIRIGCAVGLD